MENGADPNKAIKVRSTCKRVRHFNIIYLYYISNQLAVLDSTWSFYVISFQCAPSALLLAAKNGCVEACRLLLKFNARIDTPDMVYYVFIIRLNIYYRFNTIIYREATLLFTWQ